MATLASSMVDSPGGFPIDRVQSTASTSDDTYLESPHTSEEMHMTTKQEISPDEVKEIRKGLQVLHQSRSMQGMRPVQPVKEVKKSGLRNRAFSASETNNVVMPRPAPYKAKPTQIAPTLSTRNSRQEVPKSGGFSAFIRKITGRSTSPPKAKVVVKEVPVVEAKSTPAPPRPIPKSRTASTSSTSVIPTVKPILASINVDLPRDRLAPASAPAAPQPGAILAGPVPPCPPKRVMEAMTALQEVDPCEVPLPVSRPASPELLPVLTRQSETSEDVPSLSRSSSRSGVSRADSTIRRTKASGILNAEEIDDDEREELTEADEDASESEDLVRELQPIRIPSGGHRGYTNEQLHTPSSITGGIEEIVTPTSMGGSPPGIQGMRLAGSSPPHKAPVGTGLPSSELGRKGSKWRKSMMGLSDTLNGKSATRKQSIRAAPPTSYDAYQAHQRRIANNRVSCAPTIHSQASIAAEAREIRDKQESELTETFFLS